MHSDEAVTLRLDAKGTGANTMITAADIQPHSDVDILNSDLHIATLAAGARLAIDITVSKGRGYVSADRNKTTTTIGVIPVDSIFSPVRPRGVRGRAHPRGAGHQLRPPRARHRDRRFDHAPRGARVRGGHAHLARRAGARHERRASGPRARRGVDDHGRSPDLDLPIEDLDLSERPRNCLKRAQVNTIGELLLKTDDDLLAITNFGQKSLDEVKAKLDERGLQLRVKE